MTSPSLRHKTGVFLFFILIAAVLSSVYESLMATCTFSPPHFFLSFSERTRHLFTVQGKPTINLHERWVWGKFEASRWPPPWNFPRSLVFRKGKAARLKGNLFATEQNDKLCVWLRRIITCPFLCQRCKDKQSCSFLTWGGSPCQLGLCSNLGSELAHKTCIYV